MIAQVCLLISVSLKGVTKKLDATSKSRANANIALWTKSIANHMCWCSVSSPEDEEDRVEVVTDKWLSILNHVADIHEGHGTKFPVCTHGELGRKTWIKKGIPVNYMYIQVLPCDCLCDCINYDRCYTN